MRLLRPYFTSRRRPAYPASAFTRPASSASATSLLGWPVLMPTSVGPLPRSASTSSQVWRYLRVGLSLSESHTTAPGTARPIMEPVLGQVAVTSWPSSRRTSARKRL